MAITPYGLIKVFRWARSFFLLLVGVLFLLLAYSFIGGMAKRGVSFIMEKALSEADSVINRFSFIQTTDGEKNWELRAVRAEAYEAEDRVNLEDVSVVIAASPDLLVTFRGDEGSLNTRTKDFFVSKKEGDLLIHFGNTYTIQTREFKWVEADRIILASGSIRIEGGGMEITGKRLRGDLSTQEFSLVGDVVASFK